jgi:N-formylglutamate amidohydrolase
MHPAVPLVLDSPHSGHDFPPDFDAIVSEAELRESEDCYVARTVFAAAHAATARSMVSSTDCAASAW